MTSRRVLVLAALGCLAAGERNPGGSPWPGVPEAGAEVRLGPATGAPGDGEVHAWSPDGRWLYTRNGYDGVMRWDAATGWPDGALATGHDLGFEQLAADPRGRWLVGLMNEELVTIALPAGTVERRMHVDAGDGFFTDLGVHPDGSRLALGRCSVEHRATVLVLDAATGEVRHKLEEPENCTKDLAWLSDGRLVAAGEDHRYVVWSAAGRKLAEGAGDHVSAEAVALSPDERQIAVGGYADAVNVHDLGSGAAVWSMGFMGSEVRGLGWSRDGRFLAAQWGRSLGVWDTTSHRRVARWEGARGPLSFGPDGKRVVWAQAGSGFPVFRDVGRWDAPTVLLDAHTDVRDLAFSPDGSELLVADDAGTVAVWDVASGRLLRWIREPGARGALAADWHDGQPVLGEEQLRGPDDYVVDVEAGPRGQLAVLLRDAVWVDGQLTERPDRARELCWTGDGRLELSTSQIACGGSAVWVLGDRKVQRRDRDEPLYEDESGPYLRDLAASPDDRWLVAAGDPTLVLDARSGKVVQRIEVALERVAWSPDGRRWAGGGPAGTVYVWRAP